MSGVFVLDFDGQIGVETMKRLGLVPHIRTPSGGAHVYVRHDGRRVATWNHASSPRSSELFPGMDVRGDGGYAGFHGSVAAGKYEAVRPLNPEPIASLPPDLLGRLFPPPPPSGNHASTQVATVSGLVEDALRSSLSMGRNNAGFQLARQLRDAGLDREAAFEAMHEFQALAATTNMKGASEPYAEQEVEATLASAFSRPSRVQIAVATSIGDRAATWALTDLGNAERFVLRHGAHVRFCATSGSWFVWDGRRWALDRDGNVHRLATETVRAIYREAESSSDKSERQKLAQHAVRSEAQPRVRAMLELAKSAKPIATVPEAFDGRTTSFILNVENGTLDLATGDLHPHEPDDYITKLASVVYEPGARSPEWERFLEKQVPDPEMRAFLARAAGYTLTGDTREEVLFFVCGPTASGKSTFTQAMNNMLGIGAYAVTCPFETFLRRGRDIGPRPDVARLAGSRMALALEVDEGRSFDVGVLKNLTGGDTIAARHLYQDFFDFQPQFKLWLAANDRPHVNPQDGAAWRRVLVVPFDRTVPEAERDRSLKSVLMIDPKVRKAILAWAVEGCLEWQRVGLRPPDTVAAATKAYRDECDDVGRFLAESFDPKPLYVTAKLMHERYSSWCGMFGVKPLHHLGKALRQHGLVDGKHNGVRAWRFPSGTAGQRGQQIPITPPSRAPHVGFSETAVHGVLPSTDADVEAESVFGPKSVEPATPPSPPGPHETPKPEGSRG